MTEQERKEEEMFAANCILEKINEMHDSGSLSDSAHREITAKVKPFA